MGKTIKVNKAKEEEKKPSKEEANSEENANVKDDQESADRGNAPVDEKAAVPAEGQGVSPVDEITSMLKDGSLPEEVVQEIHNYCKLKRQVKAAPEKEDGSEEVPEKKVMSKKEDLNPEEAEAEGAKDGNTTTNAAVIGNKQDVFNPSSAVNGAREATGNSNSPSSLGYTGKSLNFEKSPLFVEMSKHFAALGETVSKKLEATEKSVSDRIANMNKALEAMYNKPMYKAISEETNPEGVQKIGIKEQLAKGKFRTSN